MAELFGERQLLSKINSLMDDTTKNVPSGQGDIDSTEYVNASEALQNKVVCLFFSAGWCAPCQHFIHQLRDLHAELKKRKEPMEIVFISFDKSEKDMLAYYTDKHGDWLALPFEDDLKDTLTEKYSISVIPKLIVVQPNGAVITSKGRKDVQDKGVVCMRGWQQALQKPTNEHKEDQAQQQVVN